MKKNRLLLGGLFLGLLALGAVTIFVLGRESEDRSASHIQSRIEVLGELSEWQSLSSQAWSQDGKILFVGGEEGEKLVSTDRDGGNPKVIAYGEDIGVFFGVFADPSWSPDGDKIVYSYGGLTSCFPTEIWVMNSDGTGKKQLTRCVQPESVPKRRKDMPPGGPTYYWEGRYEHPIWSHDGSKIAFCYALEAEEKSYVFMIDSDGSNMIRLTEGRHPCFSPDGRKIAYSNSVGEPGNRHSFIFVTSTEGSQIKRLTSGAGDATEPSWSPDGMKIAFVSWGKDERRHLYLINTDGTDLTQLTDGPDDHTSPAWSPDGRELIFLMSQGTKRTLGKVPVGFGRLPGT